MPLLQVSNKPAQGQGQEKEVELEGCCNMQVYWHLCHAVFCVGLEYLYQAMNVKQEGNLAKDIAK